MENIEIFSLALSLLWGAMLTFCWLLDFFLHFFIFYQRLDCGSAGGAAGQAILSATKML
jgi:hypothetical protein